MKRKVIQIADSTQLVSLPRKWALEHGIKKGEELDVREEGHTLVVSADKEPHENEIEIDLSGLTPRLADRFVARAYQKGYDTIKVNYKNHEIFEAIQKKVPELLGFEILQEDANSCVVKSISAKLNIDFDESLKKAFTILVEMAEGCFKGYKEGDKNKLKNLFYKDFDVNKFCYFCERVINKQYYTEPIGIPVLYSLIDNLEDIADEFKYMGERLINSKKKKEILVLLEELDKIVKKCYEFFYKPEKEKSVEAMKIIGDIKEKIIGAMKLDLSEDERYALLSMDTIREKLYLFPTLRLDTLKVEK